ncbi:MAG: type IV pilus modification PilV family protein [Planctomycetota bacterium]|jgi:Tfp pilus assembly protein PilV
MRRKLNKPSPGPATAKRKAGGFTFTEVIVASSLLALAMVPILRALTQAHLTSVAIERRTKCLVFAQTKLDDIKAESIYNWQGPPFSENNTSLGGDYLCTVNDNAAGTDLKNISVKVGYDHSGNGQLGADEVEVELVTYVARRW